MSACEMCGHDPDARVTARWSFSVDKEIESLNRTARNTGGRWARAAYRKTRDEWVMWMTAARINGRIPKASGKRRVTIERAIGYRQREYDSDNMVGGCKALVDAMVRADLLVGDKREQAEIHYAQVKRDGARGVRITIEELG